MPEANDDKPALLKAIELVLADPADIKRKAEALHQRYRERYGDEKQELGWPHSQYRLAS